MPATRGWGGPGDRQGGARLVREQIHGVRGPGARESGTRLKLFARLETAIPSALTFTRASGAASYQKAVALDGTTFIDYFTTGQVDVPRFHYLSATGRRMLLVEPARTNALLDSNFVDTGPDDIPDGWLNAGGTPGTDYNVITSGGPHGGAYLQLEDTAVANRGVYHGSLSLAATTTYSASGWFRRTGTPGAANVFGFALNPSASEFSIGTGPYDWTRQQGAATTVGAATIGYVMEIVADPEGITRVALPQIEAAAYASTWIPTSGATATRSVERCRIASAQLSSSRGFVSFLWCPLWANTGVSGTATLFAWGTNDRIDFDGASDTLRVVNDSVVRATSAALTFSRETLHRISVRYGAAGTVLSVDGVETTDATAWVSVPALDGHLGTSAAGGNLESAAYGDLLLAA